MPRFSPMILVTGATGHIGSAVAQHLAAKGAELRLLVRGDATSKTKAESGLAATGLPSTVLRNGKYAEQLLEDEMCVDNAICGARREAEVAWISRADSARVIAEVLLAPPGGLLHYTGPEAPSLAETAQRLSKTLGREFRFHEESAHEAKARILAKQDTSEWKADLAAGTNLAVAANEYAATHDASRWLPNPETLEAAFSR